MDYLNQVQQLLSTPIGVVEKYIDGSGKTSVGTVFSIVFVVYILFILRNNLMPAIIVAGVVTVTYVFNKDKLVDMFQNQQTNKSAESSAESEEKVADNLQPGDLVPLELHKVPTKTQTQ